MLGRRKALYRSCSPRMAHADDEVRAISEPISDQKEELDRLGRSAQAHGSAAVLDAVIDSLRSKVGKAGITVDPEARDAATVRGWRASLDALHAESQRRVARLAVLAKESGRLPTTRAALARSREQLSLKEQALVSVDQDRSAAERDLQLAEQQL